MSEYLLHSIAISCFLFWGAYKGNGGNLPGRRSSLSPLISGVINRDEVISRKIKSRRIPTITRYPTEFALYVPSGRSASCAEHVGNQPWMTHHWQFILRYTTLLKGHLAAGDMTSAWKLVEDMEVSWQKIFLLDFLFSFFDLVGNPCFFSWS